MRGQGRRRSKKLDRVVRAFYASIGASIKEERSRADWSVERLANALGVTHKLIYQYEAGEVMIPVWRVQQIAEAMHVAFDDLIPAWLKP